MNKKTRARQHTKAISQLSRAPLEEVYMERAGCGGLIGDVGEPREVEIYRPTTLGDAEQCCSYAN